jgi:hypothetical protein
MKKLLLILLCLPMIGFGQIAVTEVPKKQRKQIKQNRKNFLSFEIGPNSLIPFNSTYNSINIHTNIGISTNLSYKIYITQHYTYNAKYVPSISFNLVSFTKDSESGGLENNANFSLLSISNGIEKNINNRLSFSLATSLDILLKDKGTYTIDYDKLTFGEMIDSQSGFVYPTLEELYNYTSSGEYERNKLGYYGSFNIKFSYVILQIHFLQFFVFTDFNVPFYYSQEQHNMDLQFNRFSSVGLGLNF